MATKIESKCPDCFYEFMENKRSGKCRNCEGTGEAPDPMDSFTEAATFGLSKADNICKICSGTGQCQTCGGTGYVYSYENDSVSTSQTSSPSGGGIQGLFISIFGIEKGILYYRIGFLAIFGAVVYFLFTVAIPLIVINIATISLLLGLAKNGKNKFLFTLSILGMLFLILDYNKGWLTITLPSNAPTFKGAIPLFFYLNIAAGLVAAYFLIRDYLNEKNAPAEGESEFSKRNLIVMGSLVLLGGLTIGGQKYFETSNIPTTNLIQSSSPSVELDQSGINFIGKWYLVDEKRMKKDERFYLIITKNNNVYSVEKKYDDRDAESSWAADVKYDRGFLTGSAGYGDGATNALYIDTFELLLLSNDQLKFRTGADSPTDEEFILYKKNQKNSQDQISKFVGKWDGFTMYFDPREKVFKQGAEQHCEIIKDNRGVKFVGANGQVLAEDNSYLKYKDGKLYGSYVAGKHGGTHGREWVVNFSLTFKDNNTLLFDDKEWKHEYKRAN